MTLVIQVVLNINLSNLNNISKFHVYFPVEKFSVSKKAFLKHFDTYIFYKYVKKICSVFHIYANFMCILYLISNLKMSVDINLTDYNCNILVALTLYSHLRMC